MYARERAPLREIYIFDFQQIYSVIIGCKKSATEDEINGKDNKYFHFALKYATPCKLVCKCDIYHPCL